MISNVEKVQLMEGSKVKILASALLFSYISGSPFSLYTAAIIYNL